MRLGMRNGRSKGEWMTQMCVAILACLALAAAASAQPPAAGKAPAAEFFPGAIRLTLPPVIYAVAGLEMNVYFDNVVLAINPANYAFGVTCDKGVHQTERWTYTPDAKDVGDHSLIIDARDNADVIVARAKTTVRVVAPTAGAGQSVSFLCIGSSEAWYPGRLQELCKPEGNPKLKLVGSGVGFEGGETRSDAYGGWTAERFATYYAPGARAGDYEQRHLAGSPFIYHQENGENKLDFARYCAEFNEGKGPDFVVISVGGNDIFYATDANIDQQIDTMLKYYDILIAMIHGVNKETKIGAMLLLQPSASQDGFGADYKCGPTRWQYKRNRCRLDERMIEHFGGREAENISVVPVSVNIDGVHDFPTKTAPWNAETKETGTRQCGALHPGEAGHKQMGDTIYCWLKAQMAAAH